MAPDNWQRRIAPLFQFELKFCKVPGYSLPFHILEGFFVHPAPSTIGFGPRVGLGQYIRTERLVVQTVEAILRLRFRFVV